ncbi:S-adenosyl-L-methionine-dependent methyltransferase [Diplogelasinospora grovesii]|uniref:S-adenosyl-L-methionine-dependent methyltransferase n=1 Tax=Diplogelasinospora grovesii TaxID=303347 RepID=A0AAN6N1U6_9PEZI|nr:S-adenosyl-L-methionine-dependent methyltransferase [Diplogelasinospora grovesii]
MSHITEKTFSTYNQEQGKVYAQTRRDYHPSVYQAVIGHHTSTGGQLDTLLDVGCGPGNVARALAPHFAHAIGIDPSEGMIATARSLGGVTSTSEPIQFEVSTAEELSPVADSSVDLIAAGNAAHWFDMPRFWAAAARVLKPGGSVALWTTGDIRAHPSVSNAAAIQDAMEEHHRQLEPYYLPGNFLVRNRYKDLPLPWTLPKPVSELDESTFFRKDWNDDDEQFFEGLPEADLDTFEKMMATGSAQTRWRQAHPDDVGTERDVIRILRRRVEGLMREAGVEEGKDVVKGTVLGTVLVVKKKV